jgi:hypothetical protein
MIIGGWRNTTPYFSDHQSLTRLVVSISFRIRLSERVLFP